VRSNHAEMRQCTFVYFYLDVDTRVRVRNYVHFNRFVDVLHIRLVNTWRERFLRAYTCIHLCMYDYPSRSYLCIWRLWYLWRDPWYEE